MMFVRDEERVFFGKFEKFILAYSVDRMMVRGVLDIVCVGVCVCGTCFWEALSALISPTFKGS